LPQGLPELDVRELIGQGGMGRVYKAWHVRLECFVAVKVMSRRVAHGDPGHGRFEREMKVLGQLNHPNIVRVRHAGEANGSPYLVMDYLDGMPPSKYVRERGPLPVAEACELARQAALGLHYAHAHERLVVHRDVKPGNLMRTPEGVVKILDMSLARMKGMRGRWPLKGVAFSSGT
jgi:serine/threonine protein kinase